MNIWVDIAKVTVDTVTNKQLKDNLHEQSLQPGSIFTASGNLLTKSESVDQIAQAYLDINREAIYDTEVFRYIEGYGKGSGATVKIRELVNAKPPLISDEDILAAIKSALRESGGNGVLLFGKNDNEPIGADRKVTLPICGKIGSKLEHTYLSRKFPKEWAKYWADVEKAIQPQYTVKDYVQAGVSIIKQLKGE